jgi:hypothetical protein
LSGVRASRDCRCARPAHGTDAGPDQRSIRIIVDEVLRDLPDANPVADRWNLEDMRMPSSASRYKTNRRQSGEILNLSQVIRNEHDVKVGLSSEMNGGRNADRAAGPTFTLLFIGNPRFYLVLKRSAFLPDMSDCGHTHQLYVDHGDRFEGVARRGRFISATRADGPAVPAVSWQWSGDLGLRSRSERREVRQRQQFSRSSMESSVARARASRSDAPAWIALVTAIEAGTCWSHQDATLRSSWWRQVMPRHAPRTYSFHSLLMVSAWPMATIRSAGPAAASVDDQALHHRRSRQCGPLQSLWIAPDRPAAKINSFPTPRPTAGLREAGLEWKQRSVGSAWK